MGRLANAMELGHGVKVHAIEPGRTAAYCRGKALCGAEPGKRSAGWSQVEPFPISCPKCLKKLESKSVWINFYPVGSVTYQSKEEADRSAEPDRLKCIEVKKK